AVNAKQITSLKLLNDIPAWLKTLRLHKYTAALDGIPWKELIYLSDEQLEQRGVTAMGARGKLLKAFDVVKQHYEDGLIE
ncbi:Vts1p, partial [Cyberlindnera jadinii NRRL Y-1542]